MLLDYGINDNKTIFQRDGARFRAPLGERLNSDNDYGLVKYVTRPTEFEPESLYVRETFRVL